MTSAMKEGVSKEGKDGCPYSRTLNQDGLILKAEMGREVPPQNRVRSIGSPTPDPTLSHTII